MLTKFWSKCWQSMFLGVTAIALTQTATPAQTTIPIAADDASGVTTSGEGIPEDTIKAPYASWQILVLVYTQTDFAYVDEDGRSRHVVAMMTPAERWRAVASSELFFEYDLPLLSSGLQQPEVTIRYPEEPLANLADFCHFWPDMDSTAADLDPNFDSVLVIWDDTGTDINSGEAVNLLHCGGLNWPNGVGQTYTIIPVDSINRDNRNVFKHEWGHAILSYFKAADVVPEPYVSNHINDTDTRYVNCLSGQPYILEDETHKEPLPNSIYHNEVGFTHDYYSGLTATPDQPDRCLGINAEAWLSPSPTQRREGADRQL